MKRMVTLSLSLLIIFVGWLPNQQSHATTAKDVGNIVFSEVEKRLIDEYFGRRLGRLPERTGARDDDDDDRKKHRGGKGKGKGNQKAKHDGKSRGKSKGLPPGLAGRKDLPPGIQKQIARGQRVPDDVETYRLPEDLIRRLPRVDREIDRRVIGDDVVLIERGTNLILDVMEGVLRSRR